MPLSSSGSGHLSFKEAAGIRLPLGVGYYERKFIMNYQLSVILKRILPGSMPERLMGTDCKFVGYMSTLVQIQLGPRIRHEYDITNFFSTNVWYGILYGIIKIIWNNKEFLFFIYPIFSRPHVRIFLMIWIHHT